MGKQGPCYHCGATSTPLWRNGPPEKPVLCNACGSRWRTKGSLANYTPLHARTEHDDFEDYRMARVRSIAIKNKEARGLKRKQSHDTEFGTFASDGNQGLYKGFDEDTSNRSSSGSAISNSESCAQFGGDASDLTVVSGPVQNIVWDSMVPSKKRTGVTRPKQSPVEKLTKDLCTILHEQQSACFSGSSEDDLLYESDKPMVSVEIGHGSVLIRHPSYIPREEESEASSLSVDNKLHPVNEAYSRLTYLPVHNNSKGVKLPSPETEAMKKPTGQFIMEQGQTKRDQPGKRQTLGHQNSLLCSVSLKEIVNFDEFVSRLTRDEQLQLLKYLPSIDTSGPSESLKSMFQSRQFEESLSTFQKLLAEGVLDNTPPEATTEGHRMLKKFLFCNLTKSKWVEKYTSLKDGTGKSSTCMSEGAGEYNVIATGHSVNAKKIRDGQGQKFPGANATMRSPKRSMTKVNHDNRELMDNDSLGFTPKNLFASDNCSLVLDSFQSADASYDQDLLLDVPSNSSFPQAELLFPTSSFAGHASTSCSSVYPHLRRP